MPLLPRLMTLLMPLVLTTWPTQLFKDPEFIEAKDFQVRSVGLATSTVSFGLLYYNPNNFRLQLKDADMDVFIDDRLLGHSRVDSLIDIPAKDSFSIPVNMDVEMKNLFPNALSFLTKNEVELSVKGKARVGKNGFYIPIPIRYKGKQSIQF